MCARVFSRSGDQEPHAKELQTMSMTGDHTTIDDGLDHAGKRLRDVAAKAGEKVQKFADKLNSPEGLNRAYGEVEERASRAYGAVRERVKERPGVALGVAAGAGMLIGMLLTRRR
jgi:ElaB/YqjD/DUF883 family membrane-anchored ribosome-binding protein